MLTTMKWFRGVSDLDDMRKAIDALKAAEGAVADAFVSPAQRHEWTKSVPVRLRQASELRALANRIYRIRSQMQEDEYQYRKYHELPPPPDGYT